MSKNVFTTNWYMYKVCLPLIMKNSESTVQLQIQNVRSESMRNIPMKGKEAKQGR
ncbi:hypothetical protein KEJ17_07965 [Candidatus Bathyarchaeota archaeon]|nr:hypothetical protein [Candidatus Bathyarchaeota archaeon]